ncbi:diguanylate cyclase [Leptolyngbya sp. FACHB-541]|uniref:sensor domain-containing diguanylate cyclase n=1 Tax=Leptolyngbya sp. FACHB-541 TaxID=2692810 RepID=UPI001689EADF|nr:sensor domain-containing diguanylate cyclase [Leptolyngbya sp. FACHB-541]MBD1998326.1 diguanylate cyclase [Leptolyngbya sp. FACHB-541]
MSDLEEINQLLQAKVERLQKAEKALRQNEANLLNLIESTQDAVWSVDSHYTVLTLNLAFKQLFLLAFDVELAPGMNAIDCLPAEQRTLWIDYYNRALKGDRFDAEHYYFLNDISIYLDISFNPIFDRSGLITGVAVFSRDITNRKQTETQLLHSALHDGLTGLPNRTLFLERLTYTAERVQRQNGLFAVMFLDLDQFKLINDQLGHSAGDHLLCQFAQELENCLHLGDTASHFGNDEFAILLDNISDISEATSVVECIQQRLVLPFTLNRHEVFVTASIGIALSNGYDQPQDLLHYANVAMHRAKESGKTCYKIFDAENV